VTPPGEGGSPLVGWLLVGFGLLDVGQAVFFAFVRPPADERARKVFPPALAMGALLLMGLGAAFLLGFLGGS